MPATYGFLSTHPPTQCGLATFNAALAVHLTAGAMTGGVVRLLAGDQGTDPGTGHGADSGAGTGTATGSSAGTDQGTGHGVYHDGRPDVIAPRVVHTWHTDHIGGWAGATNALNRFDVAVVQHEYGIYPGYDGDEVLPLLRNLTVPSIVVLHTVLTTPSPLQKSVLERIVAAADAVVLMTDTARRRLIAGYRVDARKLTVIPHGAGSHTSAPSDRHEQPHLLTWGLLGPGKGIEWGLQALALLQDLHPAPIYTVAGRTHPKVLEQHGDVYRESLKRLAADRGVADRVRWDDVYHDQASLSRLIRSADVVVLPYDSTEQVTSGVLIEAVGAGVPVVATAFPHAVELLAEGPGLLVPHHDPQALADAIRKILTQPELASRLAGLTGAPTLRWPAVAARYQALATRLLAAKAPTAAPVPA